MMNFAIKRRRNHRLETLFEIKNKIGFEKNKYLLQLLELLGGWVHSVISRLPKNCLVWGEKFVMQASTNWGQNNSNTKMRLDQHLHKQ